MAFDRLEAKISGEIGEDQHPLLHGEGRAEADARTSAEGNIGGALRFLAGRIGEAVGIETEWVGPEAGVSVDDELGGYEDGSARAYVPRMLLPERATEALTLPVLLVATNSRVPLAAALTWRKPSLDDSLSE